MANDNLPPEAAGPGTKKHEASSSAPRRFAPAEPLPPGRRGYLVLLAVLVGVGLLYWLATVFADWNKVQTCVSYGGRNCAPRVDITNH